MGHIKRDIVVYISHRESDCAECDDPLPPGRWLRFIEGNPICLSCADLDRLEFLESGDAALTRRAVANSPLHAVVVKWSRARKRNERQGVLVTREAIERAEELCHADQATREARRQREAERRARLDRAYIAEFAAAVALRYPGIPVREATEIAERACERYSGRVGRSAAAKALDDAGIELAVVAHVRHVHTDYDSLLADGCDRQEARRALRSRVAEVLARWRPQDRSVEAPGNAEEANGKGK